MTTDDRITLPSGISPSKYRLSLSPDMQKFTFDGEVQIAVEVLNTVNTIVLNAAELQIQKIAVTTRGKEVGILDSSLDEEDETLTISLESEIAPGNAEISIQFVGQLNDRLLGFYRSSYKDIKGDERYLATTQFESTDARRAFPCWDEPEHKATFDVTLVIPEHLTAVSNMPVISQIPANHGKTAVNFDTTPVMSTYLLAFIVGDISCIEQKSTSGTLMRVWTTKGKEEQGRFALETSLELLDFYNNYFGIPFPLPKLDHIAIPDFAAGAMENWGAITYREVALLVDPENSSAGTRQIVAAIISHEMAHMWFGDLVTMKWWNDLWLNESFASWMGDKAVDSIHPEWDMWTQFLTADTASAFSLDGLTNSHPIEQEVNNPAEIGQLFDAISYSKGGSVLRMLEDYIGAEDFRTGISDYLNKHSYSNAETSDLWNALGESSGKPVSRVMDSWVKQTGFPVLSPVRKKEQLSISQQRFRYENISSSTASDKTKWFIPIKVSSQSTENISDGLIESSEESINLNTHSNEWFKLNPDQTGFYRVNYQTSDLSKLEEAIQNGDLNGKDRLGLQGDAYALCRAGYSSVSSFLSLSRAYSKETEAPVLSDLASGLRGIENLIEGSDFHNLYMEFCRGIFQNIAENSGWDKKKSEGHLQALLRSTALSNLGHYGDEDTLHQASSKFSLYATNPDSVHPDIRSVVFNLAAKIGNRDTYDLIWNLEKTTELQEEKVRFHSALTNFSDTYLLNETLERSLTNDIRVQDTIRVIVSVASSGTGRSLAWDFVRNNWDELDRRYGDGGFALMRLVSLVSGFSTLERLKEVEDFFSSNPTPAAERTIEQAKERIRLNSAWLNKYSGEVEDFLRSL